jgi:hypothetical protein
MSIDYVKLITEVIKSYEEDKKETDQERRERIERDKANIQRIDNQVKR